MESNSNNIDLTSHLDAYENAQNGIMNLKKAVFQILMYYPNGLRNVDIGKSLGIYHGHVGHEGHISRTLLELMKHDGIVKQNDGKLWTLVFPETDKTTSDELE